MCPSCQASTVYTSTGDTFIIDPTIGVSKSHYDKLNDKIEAAIKALEYYLDDCLYDPELGPPVEHWTKVAKEALEKLRER
jgi:hypothetical protein